MKDVTWSVDYFSKIEFIIRSGGIIFGFFECNIMMSELSYQECGSTGLLVFEHNQQLSEQALSLLLHYVRLSDFERYRQDRIPLGEKKIVGIRDAFSITFKGYSQDGQPLLTYEMTYVYKDWYNQPVDKLYAYISKTFFSNRQKERCFIAHGLMTGVLPF